MDAILRVQKLLKFSVSLPQLSNLLLQSLLDFFGPTERSLLLVPHELVHLRAPSLNGVDELIQELLAVPHCYLSRALFKFSATLSYFMSSESPKRFGNATISQPHYDH